MRDAADSWMLMMYNMQGIRPEDSAHLRSLLRKGTPPAQCDELCDDLGECKVTTWTGKNPEEGLKSRTVWNKGRFRRVQNILGFRPQPGDYEKYQARMEARRSGDRSCCNSTESPKLPSAETVGPVRKPSDPEVKSEEHFVIAVTPGAMSTASLVGLSALGMSADAARGQTRTYRVTAFNTDLIYNKFGDHDPEAMMYALEDDVLRFQLAATKGFGAGHDPLFLGQRSDTDGAIPPEPLVLRANVGDTVRIVFKNALSNGLRASIYMHKGIYVDGSNGSLTGRNADGTIGPGGSMTYTLRIPDRPNAEGTYYFYSHADPRYQVAHGLFGALIVEPKDHRWFDSYTDTELGTRSSDGGPTGWAARIVAPRTDPTDLNSPKTDPAAFDFREHVVFFHDRVRLVNTAGVSLSDPFGLVPDPGGKALSYRSEPFFNLLTQVGDINREPLCYSGYTFGDSSTPHPRWYVGDPAKMRVLHAGGGEYHVFHNHIQRWRRDPAIEAGQNLTLPSKHDEHDASLAVSNRIDSQVMSPGEAFTFAFEGGAGSVERAVGDILMHCHFIEHVVEGMWTYHRVYNTLQTEDSTIVDTPSGRIPGGPLAVLPDRSGMFLPAVDSLGLRDMMPFTVMAGLHKNEVIDTDAKLETLIRDQLPPPGTTGFDDASMWDYIAIADPGGSGGLLFLGEPLGTFFGPGWPAAGEGEGAIAQNRTVTVGEEVRPVLKFNPLTDQVGNATFVDARLAYPHLKPHLNKRPPFAPFGPTDPRFDPANPSQGTPYMGPQLDPGDLGGASGLDHGSGLAPADAPVRTFDIRAIRLPIQYNQFGDSDPVGEVFVLAQDMDDVLNGTKAPQPLVIRINEGEVADYRITNMIPDKLDDHVSKSTVSIHSHLVEYDVQGSDGAVAGMNYETGILFGETVHQRFYGDVELGTVYQHDHAILLQSLPRGLFMALIVEPRDATHHNPKTGAVISSGPIADIRLPGGDGFREFAVLFGSETRLQTTIAEFTPREHAEAQKNPELGFTSMNTRAEPLINRLAAANPLGLGTGDFSNELPFAHSSVKHGDPSTDLWEAYVGDPVRLRFEGGGPEAIWTFRTPGHRFRYEIGNPNSDLRDFWIGGPSATRDFALEPGAGGASAKAGDYPYMFGEMDHWQEGSWGLFRVYNTVDESFLQTLPGNAPPAPAKGGTTYAPGANGPVVNGVEQAPTDQNPPAAPTTPDAPWPLGTTVRHYDVVAKEGLINYTPGTSNGLDVGARFFILSEDVPAYLAGLLNPLPLVIRANAGEGIEVSLTNALATDHVGMMPSLVGLDPRQSLGATFGFNPAQTVAPGQTRTYRWYADRELGTVILSDTVNLDASGRNGLWGTLIVEPAGAVWLNTRTGSPLHTRPDGGPTSTQAIIHSPDGSFETFREGVIAFHDSNENFQYPVFINYRSGRREGLNTGIPGGPTDDGKQPDPMEPQEHSSGAHGDPPTLLLEAHEGDPFRLRLFMAAHHDNHSFSLHGHQFAVNGNQANADKISVLRLTPGAAYNLRCMAGGPTSSSHPGDFLFHCHVMDHKKMGMWGIMRVHPQGSEALAPLPEPPPPTGACCKNDGTCSVKSQVECNSEDGNYMGDDVACADANCPPPPPTGACCKNDGSCSLKTHDECSNENGNYMGDDVTCANADCPPPPPTGACCKNDGSCSVKTQDECNNEGGNYRGDDVTCANADCPPPPPTGACCKSDGPCSVKTQDECNSDGGDYKGDNVACVNADCPPPPPTGACCLSDGSCSVVTQAECIGQNADYKGDSVSCAQADCQAPQPPPTGACCLSDGSCSFVTQAKCIGQNGDYKGDSVICAQADCQPPAPDSRACCLSDGTCQEVPTDDICLGMGGTPSGLGSTCNTVDCPSCRFELCGVCLTPASLGIIAGLSGMRIHRRRRRRRRDLILPLPN